MRYKVTQQPVNKHTEIVTGVSWSAANELLSVSDDKKVWLWNVEGEPQTQVAETDTFCTELLWFPTVQGRSKEAEVFVVGCTDGSFKLISKAGRVEKVVTGAHSGAVTALKWSNDGSSLATCGEDGAVKSWSRNGMFRANLAQARLPPPPPAGPRWRPHDRNGHRRRPRRPRRPPPLLSGAHERHFGRQGEGTIHTLCWSPESDQILFSSGKHLVIRPLQPSSKQTMWKVRASTVTEHAHRDRHDHGDRLRHQHRP